ncbi:SDR family NAD(P)-dependent oxidoreductase [Arthrobacter sp. MI7-26]|uniref:SDR family NAD(P)-dependent oxidoreductase n=1 Tax=Arthrobacter sp. MI7-26 TaxID=2993653 RepID=UPI003A5987D3
MASKSLITGAAGGIGRAAASELGRRGYSIVVADLDSTACDLVVAEIVATGVEAAGVQLNVTDSVSAEAAVAEMTCFIPKVSIFPAETLGVKLLNCNTSSYSEPFRKRHFTSGSAS